MTATHTADSISETDIAGRRLGDYKPIRDYPGHNHTTDMVIGYVVRETIRDREVLWRGEPDRQGHREAGHDVAIAVGIGRYADIVAIRDSYRSTPGGYAVVDRLYACGCRY
jgi:hypothetical protein